MRERTTKIVDYTDIVDIDFPEDEARGLPEGKMSFRS